MPFKRKTGPPPSRGRLLYSLEALLDVLVGVVRLAVAVRLAALGQLHLLARRLLVRNRIEKVVDDVQPAAPLVVGARDVPGREVGVGRLEHLVARARVIVPAAVGL